MRELLAYVVALMCAGAAWYALVGGWSRQEVLMKELLADMVALMCAGAVWYALWALTPA